MFSTSVAWILVAIILHWNLVDCNPNPNPNFFCMTALSFHLHYTSKWLHQHSNYSTKGLKCLHLKNHILKEPEQSDSKYQIDAAWHHPA